MGRNTSRAVVLAVSLTLAGLNCSAQTLPAVYDIRDLGPAMDQTCSAPGFTAQDVNDAGQVVGWAAAVGVYSTCHAGRWNFGAITDLGVPQGMPASTYSFAYAVNGRGDAAGKAPVADQTVHPVVFHDGAVIDLGVLAPGGYESVALGINDTGQVAGCDQGSGHAFLYDGSLHDLGTLPGGIHSCAWGLNGRGQVVGFSHTVIDGGANADHAFLYSGGIMTDLGTLPGGSVSSIGLAINDAGQVVGNSAGTRSKSQAVLWANGTIVDLGAFGGSTSSATGINGAGIVVGFAELLSGQNHAFVWAAGTMHDLNALIPPGLGWELVGAQKINNRGQIVGHGFRSSVLHSFLLSPPGLSGTPVPALSGGALAALAAALGALGFLVLRRAVA